MDNDNAKEFSPDYLLTRGNIANICFDITKDNLDRHTLGDILVALRFETSSKTTGLPRADMAALIMDSLRVSSLDIIRPGLPYRYISLGTSDGKSVINIWKDETHAVPLSDLGTEEQERILDEIIFDMPFIKDFENIPQWNGNVFDMIKNASDAYLRFVHTLDSNTVSDDDMNAVFNTPEMEAAMSAIENTLGDRSLAENIIRTIALTGGVEAEALLNDDKLDELSKTVACEEHNRMCVEAKANGVEMGTQRRSDKDGHLITTDTLLPFRELNNRQYHELLGRAGVVLSCLRDANVRIPALDNQNVMDFTRNDFEGLARLHQLVMDNYGRAAERFSGDRDAQAVLMMAAYEEARNHQYGRNCVNYVNMIFEKAAENIRSRALERVQYSWVGARLAVADGSVNPPERVKNVLMRLYEVDGRMIDKAMKECDFKFVKDNDVTDYPQVSVYATSYAENHVNIVKDIMNDLAAHGIVLSERDFQFVFNGQRVAYTGNDKNIGDHIIDVTAEFRRERDLSDRVIAKSRAGDTRATIKNFIGRMEKELSSPGFHDLEMRALLRCYDPTMKDVQHIYDSVMYWLRGLGPNSAYRSPCTDFISKVNAYKEEAMRYLSKSGISRMFAKKPSFTGYPIHIEQVQNALSWLKSRSFMEEALTVNSPCGFRYDGKVDVDITYFSSLSAATRELQRVERTLGNDIHPVNEANIALVQKLCREALDVKLSFSAEPAVAQSEDVAERQQPDGLSPKAAYYKCLKYDAPLKDISREDFKVSDEQDRMYLDRLMEMKEDAGSIVRYRMEDQKEYVRDMCDRMTKRLCGAAVSDTCNAERHLPFKDFVVRGIEVSNLPYADGKPLCECPGWESLQSDYGKINSVTIENESGERMTFSGDQIGEDGSLRINVNGREVNYNLKTGRAETALKPSGILANKPQMSQSQGRGTHVG